MAEIKNYIEQLAGFIESQRTDFSYTRNEPFAFNLLVRASAIKCYEFLKVVFLESSESQYFIGAAYLRSIAEEIIVLKSIYAIRSDERDILLRRISELEVNNRILVQWDFFQRYRPFQPVINRTIDIENAKSEIQRIWRENGWPNFKASSKNAMPPVSQLAEKLAPGILDILYEFIYRLASSNVHFSVQSLFRMSWGDVNGEEFRGTISTNHMDKYFATFGKIYGPLLFSFYFEFFSDELAATATEQSIVQGIRKELIEGFRWPELITFEEMNLEIPEESSDELIPNGIIRQYMVQALKDGFINNKFEVFLEKIKNKTA